MSRLTRIVARAALTAVSIGVAGIGAEFSFRVLLERRYAADAADFEHFLYERDPAGEHLYRPRQGVERENEIAGTGGVTWSYRIDERGFRSGPPRSANEDATRVVALGDSYTFGWAVEDAEALIDRIGKLAAAVLNVHLAFPVRHVASVHIGDAAHNPSRRLSEKFQADAEHLLHLMHFVSQREHDHAVFHTQRFSGSDILKIACAQEFRPDNPNQGGPAEQHCQKHKEPVTSPQDR